MRDNCNSIIALAMAGALAAAGIITTTSTLPANARSTISTECSQKTPNLYRCTVSGTVTQAVTEFGWQQSPGANVAYGVFPMASGHGTIEFTPTKVIVRFDEDYAKGRQNLTFSGFTEVRLEAYHHGNDQYIILNGVKVDMKGQGYCDDECKSKDVEGVYKGMWDGKDGAVDGHVVLGKTHSTSILGNTVTLTEQGGEGLASCVFTGVETQIKKDGRNGWFGKVPATGIGTNQVTFRIDSTNAHRATFQCTAEGRAKLVSNQVLYGSQTLKASWERRAAGADGSGTLPEPTPPTPTPPAPPAPPTPPAPPAPPKEFNVTEVARVQFDTYSTRSAADKRRVAAFDDDLKLHFREDRAMWRKNTWVVSGHRFTYRYVEGDAAGNSHRRRVALQAASGVNPAQVDRVTGRQITMTWEVPDTAWRLQGKTVIHGAPQTYLGHR